MRRVRKKKVSIQPSLIRPIVTSKPERHPPTHRRLYPVDARTLKKKLTVMSIRKATDFVKKTHNDALVKVSKGLSIGVFVLNIVFPGIGTLIACLAAGKAAEGVMCFLMMWLMCFVFFVGWIWSIVHGFQIFQKSSAS